MSDWPDNDPTFTEKPRLWHVQLADESRDCDGIYPLTAHYVWARCEDQASNRADEDFDMSEGVSVTGQYDTRPASGAEVRAWLKTQAAEVGGDATETQVVVIHTGDQDDRLAAWNEGFAEAMRQNGEPDDGGKAMREFLAAHDAELTEKVRRETLTEAADRIARKDHRLDLGDDPHSAGWRQALNEAEHNIRTLSTTPERSNT
jgi:hypothetical protein